MFHIFPSIGTLMALPGCDDEGSHVPSWKTGEVGLRRLKALRDDNPYSRMDQAAGGRYIDSEVRPRRYDQEMNELLWRWSHSDARKQSELLDFAEQLNRQGHEAKAALEEKEPWRKQSPECKRIGELMKRQRNGGAWTDDDAKFLRSQGYCSRSNCFPESNRLDKG